MEKFHPTRGADVTFNLIGYLNKVGKTYNTCVRSRLFASTIRFNYLE